VSGERGPPLYEGVPRPGHQIIEPPFPAHDQLRTLPLHCPGKAQFIDPALTRMQGGIGNTVEGMVGSPRRDHQAELQSGRPLGGPERVAAESHKYAELGSAMDLINRDVEMTVQAAESHRSQQWRP